MAAADRKNGVVDHVYGGVMSVMPQELDCVQAWRPSPFGDMELALGVIHRVHRAERTVTVQFFSDQHRCRLPLSSVQCIRDITPEYQKVILQPGQSMPTHEEVKAREEAANEQRRILGIPPNQPLPGQEPGPEDNSLLRTIPATFWGIPAPTQEALRNRSIPAEQVGSQYGRHFYSSLYENRSYPQPPLYQQPDAGLYSEAGNEAYGASAVAAMAKKITAYDRSQGKHEVVPQRRKGAVVVSHVYKPLEGPELTMDMETGEWYARDENPLHLGWWGEGR